MPINYHYHDNNIHHVRKKRRYYIFAFNFAKW